ncbi:hypothetical protein GCM10010994_31350 [Chelatococcus reniformis]|uniref:Uncharacterized protein n=2 Tax=Chelatococcus reniformis TaxID=1494448 RepID=A0A916UEL9_9HYPH|nr:hypothetical protein GCM10010994_31350 [Chelatococcus reniformis]
MVRLESRGPGDVAPAMRRLAIRYRLPYGTIWALRYRKPKSIVTDIYFALAAAYEAERARQRHALREDLDVTKEIAGPDHPAVRAAEALVGKADPADVAGVSGQTT